MRIGIDARFLTHPQYGGFKTYTESLVSALAELDGENEYILYVDRAPDDSTVFPRRANFTARTVSGDLPLFGMAWREQIQLSRQASRDRLDLFHSPCLSAPVNISCPLVIIVHDMIWHSPFGAFQKGSWSPHRRLMHLYYQQIPRLAVRRSSAVLTVSEAAKNDIVDILGFPRERVFVTYEAARPGFTTAQDPVRTAAVLEKYGLPAGFVMALGAADPRKNMATLVEAYGMLPAELRARCPPVIVCSHASLAETLRGRTESLGIGHQVLFPKSAVSTEDMPSLYHAASLFAFPSRYEGFGLPPLEAMACGVPVVAADNSSIPEVLGEAASYASADDAAAMSHAMARLLTDHEAYATLRRKGLQRASQFSWEACARQTLSVYRQANGAGRPASQSSHIKRLVSDPGGERTHAPCLPR